MRAQRTAPLLLGDRPCRAGAGLDRVAVITTGSRMHAIVDYLSFVVPGLRFLGEVDLSCVYPGWIADNR